MPAFLTKYIVILLIAASGLALGLWSRQDSAVKQRPNAAPTSRTAEPSVVVTHYQPHAGNPSVSNRNTGSGSNDDTGRNDSNTCDGYAVDGSGTRTHSVSTASENTPPASESFVDMLPAVAKPLQMAELSTPTDGVLWKLSIREGDEVEADTLLALIDNRQTLAAYKVAEAGAERKAGLSVAAAKLSLAEQYLKRIENAHSQNAASGLEMDEAKSRVQEARAALEEGHELHREALARLEMEQTRLTSHELRAPFAGTVTRIKKNVGETLTRDTVLMTLADLSRLRSELYVPMAYLDAVHLDDHLTVVAALPGNPRLTAHVVHIDPILDAATNTFRVLIEVDNSQHSLPAGFGLRLIDPRSQSVAKPSDSQLTSHPDGDQAVSDDSI